MNCFVLSWIVLFCHELFCFVMNCFVMNCFVLSWIVLFCHELFCFVMNCFVLNCFVFCSIHISNSLCSICVLFHFRLFSDTFIFFIVRNQFVGKKIKLKILGGGCVWKNQHSIKTVRFLTAKSRNIYVFCAGEGGGRAKNDFIISYFIAILKQYLVLIILDIGPNPFSIRISDSVKLAYKCATCLLSYISQVWSDNDAGTPEHLIMGIYQNIHKQGCTNILK